MRRKDIVRARQWAQSDGLYSEKMAKQQQQKREQSQEKKVGVLEVTTVGRSVTRQGLEAPLQPPSTGGMHVSCTFVSFQAGVRNSNLGSAERYLDAAFEMEMERCRSAARSVKTVSDATERKWSKKAGRKKGKRAAYYIVLAAAWFNSTRTPTLSISSHS